VAAPPTAFLSDHQTLEPSPSDGCSLAPIPVDLRLLAGASHLTDTGRRKGGPPAGDLQGLHLSTDFVAAARFHVKHRRPLGTRSAPRGRHIRTEDPCPTAHGPRSAVMVGMTIYLAPIARCLRRIAAFRGGQRLGQAPVRASMAPWPFRVSSCYPRDPPLPIARPENSIGVVVRP
jgi:hypothetical protein